MNETHKKDQKLEDIVELDDLTLSLADIESIANDDRVQRHYEARYKDRLYSTILLSLTHESFKENEAKSLWNEIVSHMKAISRVLGRNVGIPVASLDYLTNIKNTLSEAKIIEEDKSTYIADATTKDELTELYLRDVFDVVLRKETDEARRNNTPLCLVMIDIDDFKTINDTYGHLKGDEVLNKLGRTINDSVREMDLAARYGGEEIAVIMPSVDIAQALQAAQRIRKTIEKLHFKDFSVTVSIGVSQTNRDINTPDRLINAADQALYRAKSNGKNRVITSNASDAS